MANQPPPRRRDVELKGFNGEMTANLRTGTAVRKGYNPELMAQQRVGIPIKDGYNPEPITTLRNPRPSQTVKTKSKEK